MKSGQLRCCASWKEGSLFLFLRSFLRSRASQPTASRRAEQAK